MNLAQALNRLQFQNDAASNQQINSSPPDNSPFVHDVESYFTLMRNPPQVQLVAHRLKINAFTVPGTKTLVNLNRGPDSQIAVPLCLGMSSLPALFAPLEKVHVFSSLSFVLPSSVRAFVAHFL